MASSPKAPGSPNSRSRANSQVASPMASPSASPGEEMDMSILSWLTNTHTVLKWPGTILTVAALLVAGAFAGIAPRKSLEFLDNTIGSAVFFIFPLVCSVVLDWPTGLLAAVVSLILFARLQKRDTSEGFSDTVDDTVDVFDPVAVRVVVGVPELVLVTLLVPDILIVIFGVLVIKID